MPDNYPKLSTKGGKQLFVFRFRVFTTSALYDPVVSLGQTDNTGDTSTQVPVADSDTLTGHRVSVKALGQSGKITVKGFNSKGKLYHTCI